MSRRPFTEGKIGLRTITLVITACFILTSLHPVAALDDEWAEFRHDVANTGYSEAPGPGAPSTILWTYDLEESVRGSPSVADGELVIGDMAGMVWALDAMNGDFLWSYATDGSVEATATIFDGTVYIGSNDMGLHAIGLADGNGRWTFATEGNVKSSVAATDHPNATGGKALIFGSYDGNLYAVDTGGKGIWRYRTGSYIHGKPSIGMGKAFSCGCDMYVHGVDVVTGEKAWNFSMNEYSGASPAVAGGQLYAPARTGMVYSINISTGQETWKYDTKGVIEASPAVAMGVVVIGNTAGDLVALDQDTGDRKWLFRAGSGIYSSAAISDGLVYFGDMDGRLHVLDIDDGNEVDNITVGAGFYSSPAIAYGRVYMVDEAGKVVAIGREGPIVRIVAPSQWDTVSKRFDARIMVHGEGITRVEVRIDDDDWNRIGPVGVDTWGVTYGIKRLKNGEHRLEARAENATGTGETYIYIIVKNPKENGNDRPFIPAAPSAVAAVSLLAAALALGWWGRRGQRRRTGRC